MIRIHRGPEGAALAATRKRRARAAAEARAEGKTPKFTGYDAVRTRLYAAQRSKCAYCERLIGAEGNPIEHFRPKAGALRGDPWSSVRPRIDPSRYWWLAWSYSNLLLACPSCNCAGRKGNWFPLASGTRPLPVPSTEDLASDVAFDSSAERPMLVDPGADQPLDHIAWVPLDPSEPIERMEWRPVHKTERGRFTIKSSGSTAGSPTKSVITSGTTSILASSRSGRSTRPAHEQHGPLRYGTSSPKPCRSSRRRTTPSTTSSRRTSASGLASC